MFHDDDSLDLLETYRKNKFQEKTNGKFFKNSNNRKLPRLSLIPIIFLIMYFIIINLGIKINPNTIVKPMQKEQEEETTTVLSKPIQTVIETPQQVVPKNIEIISNKPIILPLQNTPKIEQSKQDTTITLMPQQTAQKQTPIKKTEVEEEIHPSTSTSMGYYR